MQKILDGFVLAAFHDRCGQQCPCDETRAARRKTDAAVTERRGRGAHVVDNRGGAVVDGCGKVLVPNYNLTIAMYTFVGEPLLMFWLLWKGIKGFTPNVSAQSQALA